MAATSHGCLFCDSSQDHDHNHQTLWYLAGIFMGAVLIFNSYIVQIVFDNPQRIAAITAFVGAVLLSIPVIVRTVRDLVKGHLHMNELVAIAIAACFALEKYETAGVVAFLMLLADLIEHHTAEGAKRSVESLVKLTPQKARVIENGKETEVETAQLAPGMILRVRPGENIPADGRIDSGETAINEATITGESLPADKGPGDSVFAGTTNLTGALDVTVTRAGEDTTLGRVKELILEAESTKIPLVQMVEEYVQWYTPLVLMIAGLILFFTRDIYSAISAIIISCPCVLILATPTAMIAAISSAARLGVLVKSATNLERAGDLSTIIFDKTGTLTTGVLAVTKLAPVNPDNAEGLLELAVSAESQSNHPLAVALRKVADEAGIEPHSGTDVNETAGKGIAAVVDGRKIYIGRANWLEENKVKLDAEAVAASEAAGTTSLHVSADGTYIGWIGFEDKAREEAQEATAELKKLGVRDIGMLTGDRWAVAKRVGEELGCTSVEAECLPEKKLEVVRERISEGNMVAVVGDGINDAPALAAGDIGIAMGAAGSDVAINSASIALMSNDLRRLPFLVKLSRKARNVIYQNLFMGLIFIVLGWILAAAGSLKPVPAAVLHLVGIFFVIFNSARLFRSGEEYE